MATPAAYKPSPLGYGSPRSSPFRRPESPASPNTFRAVSQTTPHGSPLKAGSLVNGGSRFASASVSVATTPTPDIRTPGTGLDGSSPQSPRPLRSPAMTLPTVNGNALSQLQASQLRTMREGFQILDRDSDGVVNREDVADMLGQLGMPASQSDVSRFFPPSAPQNIPLPVFLNSLASSLAALSPSQELLSALSVFDDDDSGQIDVAELRDSLLHTAPERGEKALSASEVDKVIAGFTARRAFTKSSASGLGKRGMVFKYHDFVSSISVSNDTSGKDTSENSDDA